DSMVGLANLVNTLRLLAEQSRHPVWVRSDEIWPGPEECFPQKKKPVVSLFLYKERHWDIKKLVGSGGMPSSHSATVTALAVAVGFRDGFGGSLFATAMTLAFVVMFDAFGVRLQAGRQAEVLNQIVYELPAEHPLAESRPLRELLGHTPSQVIAGGFLGFITATIGHFITRSVSQA
ncbi:hypothetical protein U1Q18_043610, partial [Sarracenia purpurea var. burkii]